MIPLLFHTFDFSNDFAAADTIGTQFDSEFFGLVFHVAFARKIRHQHATLIADQLRFHMFVGPGCFHDGADVNASFVGKGAFAYKRSAVEWNHVGGFTDEPGERFQTAHIFAGNARAVHFEIENRNDGGQVGIAATFAIAVDGTLDHYRSALDGFDGIGYRHAAVVVGMNAELKRQRICGCFVFFAKGLKNLVHNRFDLRGESAAVSVAGHNKFSSRVYRRH